MSAFVGKADIISESFFGRFKPLVKRREIPIADVRPVKNYFDSAWLGLHLQIPYNSQQQGEWEYENIKNNDYKRARKYRLFVARG